MFFLYQHYTEGMHDSVTEKTSNSKINVHFIDVIPKKKIYIFI